MFTRVAHRQDRVGIESPEHINIFSGSGGGFLFVNLEHPVPELYGARSKAYTYALCKVFIVCLIHHIVRVKICGCIRHIREEEPLYAYGCLFALIVYPFEPDIMYPFRKLYLYGVTVVIKGLDSRSPGRRYLAVIAVVHIHPENKFVFGAYLGIIAPECHGHTLFGLLEGNIFYLHFSQNHSLVVHRVKPESLEFSCPVFDFTHIQQECGKFSGSGLYPCNIKAVLLRQGVYILPSVVPFLAAP